jgi:hypothetical protein
MYDKGRRAWVMLLGELPSHFASQSASTGPLAAAAAAAAETGGAARVSTEVEGPPEGPVGSHDEL